MKAPAPTLRDWLLSDRPRSRRQAAFGRAYQGWRSFARNRLALAGLVIVLLLIAIALFAPLLAPYAPDIGDLRTQRLLPPSAANWFGTDDQGRDILSRLLHGSRITLYVVALVAVLAAPIGLLEGSVLTETVFSWPGLGLYITNSLQNADMNAVLGGTLVVGTVFIALNLLSDALYRLLDPRTRDTR